MVIVCRKYYNRGDVIGFVITERERVSEGGTTVVSKLEIAYLIISIQNKTASLMQTHKEWVCLHVFAVDVEVYP